MKRLELAFNFLVAVVVLAIAAAGVWTWREKGRIYQDILSTIEAQATVAVGLPVEIGGIEGLWWKNLVLRDIKVRGYPGKDAPVVVHVPRVRANYSISEILKLGKKPVEVVVERPLVTLERDAAGQLNVRPMKRPPQEPSDPPKVPIRVKVEQGELAWFDSYQATSSQVVPFRRRIPLDNADVTVRDGIVRFLAQARDADARIRLRGRHDLVHGTGDASVQATGVAIADWSGYAVSSDDYRILQGNVDAVAKVEYDVARLDELGVSGRAWVKGLTLEHKDVLALVENVGVTAAFDLKEVRLETLAASMAGNSVTGRGKVDIRNPGDPKLDLRLDIPRVDLASAQHIVPELTPFGLSGTAAGTAYVHGSSMDPVVEVKARIDQAVAMKERLGPGTADIRFHHMKAEVSNLALAVHDGRATGTFWFTTDQAPAAGGRIAFDGVSIGPAAAPYLPRPLPLRGRASGTVDISGPTDAIRMEGSATLAEAAFGKQPVDSGRAAFLIHRGNITVSDILLAAPDGGRITGDLGWDNGGDLVLRLNADNVDLEALRRGGLDVDLSGRASASLQAAGNMMEADTLEFAGRVEAGPGQAYGQPIQDIAGHYRLSGGRLVLTDVVGHTAGGRVAGHGVVAPLSFERELPPPDVRFDFDVAGADLSRVRAVAEAAAEPLGGLSGRVSGRGIKLAVTKGKLALSGTLDAAGIDAPRIGGAAGVAGDFALDDGKLTLGDLTVAQGAARLVVAGDVALGDDPDLALRIRTAGADARTVLGAVHWRRLLQGTWMMRRSTEEAKPAKPKPFAELPDREVFEFDPSQPLDLSAVYNHWLGASATPSIVTEEHIKAARPFWESIDGTVDAEVRIDGKASDPMLFAQVDVREGKAYGHALSAASMLAWFGRGEFTVDHMVVEAKEGGRATVAGALGNGRSLEIAAESLDLSWLNPFLQGQDLTLAGKAGGRIVATGELARPRLAITAKAERGQISDFLYDSANAQATFENGLLDIQECALVKDGKEARVAGTMPIGLRPEDTNLNLTLDVRGTSLGIVSVLSKGLIDWRGGDGQLRVDIIGTQAAPRLRGALKLQDAVVAVKTLTGEISDIDAEAQIGAGIVKVEKATAAYGGGRIEANGFITMKQFKFDNYLLDLWATPLNLALPGGLFDGTIEGHLGVGGKFERPSVTGEITVSRGTLALGAQNQQGGGGGPEGAGTPIDISGLNLTIKDQVKVVQPNLMDLNVFGNLLVNGTAMQPDFKGVVNVVRGGKVTTFYTNEFKVEEGSVEFLGAGRPEDESDLMREFLPDDGPQKSVASAVPNARVNVTAVSDTVIDYSIRPESDPGNGTAKGRPVKVTVVITGSLTDLRYTFKSDPPTYSQKEIETLLGKPSVVTGLLLSPVSTGDAGVGAAAGRLAKELGPGFANFIIIKPLVSQLDPILSPFFRNYSLDLVNDPNRQNEVTGLNVALSAETKSIGPLSASYRRVINTAGGNNWDLKRYGLNVVGIPLNVKIAGPMLDWLFTNIEAQDLSLTAFLEDTAGVANEYPSSLDLSLPGQPPSSDQYSLSVFRRRETDPWRASILIGIRGRL